jgi:hypothetical protein
MIFSPEGNAPLVEKSKVEKEEIKKDIRNITNSFNHVIFIMRLPLSILIVN